jgi:CBS-domain-containing membrane protein
MKPKTPEGPQSSLLFRVIAFFSRLRFGYLLRSKDNPRFLVGVFVFGAGTVAVGIITMVAFLTDLPLIFPPLGPSAFILFYTPMAVTASPRNVILSHSTAVAAGLMSLHLVGMIYPEAGLNHPAIMNWYRVLVIAVSMAVSCVLMIIMRCEHSPAAGSALIAAMGYLGNPAQIVGLPVAVVLLVVEAFVFNRIIGGLPYPTWRTDLKVSQSYGVLAGIPDSNTTFWQLMAVKMFQRR